jgi:hypothetical protein
MDSLSRSGLHVWPVSQCFLQRVRRLLAHSPRHGRRPARPLTGVLRPCPVVAARNRVPCPPASAIEASSSMLVAKLGVAD